jgi:hypothetical protein
MFIGYSVKNAIRRCSYKDSYHIAYNAIGGCFDHLFSLICEKSNHSFTIKSGPAKMDGCYIGPSSNDLGYNFNVTLGSDNERDKSIDGVSTILIIEGRIVNLNEAVKKAISKYEYILCLDNETYKGIKSIGHPNVFHSIPNLDQVFGQVDLLKLNKNIDVLVLHSDTDPEMIKSIINELKKEGLNVDHCSDYSDDPLMNKIKSAKMILHIDEHKFTNYLYANFFGAVSLTPHQNSSNNQSIFFTPDTASILSMFSQLNTQYDQIIRKMNIEKNKNILNNHNFISDISEIFSLANNTVVDYA